MAIIEPIDLWSYTILFFGVGASWIGIPIVGGVTLAAAGVLAGDGQLNVWLVIVVAATGAWTGGYVGYVLGARIGHVLANRPGRWQAQRQRLLRAGERFYGRWGPLAVFLIPTWVSGALRMPRNSFLRWNAVAGIVSSLVTVFGAYAIAGAVLGQLSALRGVLAVAVAALVATGVVINGRRTSGRPIERRG